MTGYNESYYENYEGGNYHDRETWLPLFERFADRVVRDFSPKTVLDVGCAFGYAVKYLRAQGVEAWGIDTSSYAIHQADEQITPFLRVASGCDPLPEDMPQHYDLVINIEVLEHLTAEEGEQAIARICSYTDKVLFSSTGEGFDDPTHINVQQPEYWSALFAKYGLYKNLTFTNVDYVSQYGGLYERATFSTPEIVAIYERALRCERRLYEKEQRISSKLLSDVEIVREQKAVDEQYFRKEISRLTDEVMSHIKELERVSSESFSYSTQLSEATSEKEALAAQLSEAKTGNEALTAQLSEANTENNALTMNLSEVNAAKEALTVQLQKENEKNLILMVQLQEKEQMRSDLARKVSELENNLMQLQNERDIFFHNAERVQLILQNVTESRGYRALCIYCQFRDWVLPKGSRRRKLVKRLFSSFMWKKDRLPVLSDAAVASKDKVSFYSVEELERQNWCRQHPIHTDIKFSILVPVFNTPLAVLEAMIFSVKDQIYPNWELCIVDASPENQDIQNLIQQLSLDCDKIKYKKLDYNGGISNNTTAALMMASGDFIALLDHDDIIAPNALYEYVSVLNDSQDIDFLYSDKDMIDESGTHRTNPLYKPEYSPEIMYSANYLTHFCAIRTAVLKKTSGFDCSTDGAQDWDIFLKVMAVTSKIKRVDRILYHWRILSTSVASGVEAKPYALDAQLCALRNYIQNRNWPGKIYFADRQKSRLKVDWQFQNGPTVAAVVLQRKGKIKIPDGCDEVLEVDWENSNWKRQIQKSTADVLLFIQSDVCLQYSDHLCSELVAWALHPEIGFVIPQLRAENQIVSCGLVYEHNQVMDLFGGHGVGFYGQMGHSEWYRNISCFRDICFAIERKKFLQFCEICPELGMFSVTHNSFRASKYGLRNVYDPYAWVEVNLGKIVPSGVITQDFMGLNSILAIPEVDPYFNRNCSVDVQRSLLPVMRVNNASVQKPLDKYTEDAIALASTFDFTLEDLEKNQKVVSSKTVGQVKTMVWFLQEFDYVFYAGLYTIFRTASFLQEKYEIKHTFVFVANTPSQVMMERIGAGFPELRSCQAYSITFPDELYQVPTVDASICTLWTTAYYSLKFNRVKRKFYFIQDYEPLFYPAGSTSAQTEATYRFGFYGIANTLGLKRMYETEYGGRAVSLDPSVDTNIFYPNPQRQYKKNQYTVFFYGRPGHPRNGFELGVEAMKCLKHRMGKRVKIVTAGADYDIVTYGLEGVLENLGRLKIEETGELYRSCDAGLVMMYTRHPSYLPYELMACGCCVVSNYNAYTTWFLKDGENAIVCEPSASSIAQAIENILLDEKSRKAISKRAVEQITNFNPDWNTSLEKVADFIQEPET